MGRVGLGAAFLVAPGRSGRGWLGARATADAGKVAARALGARDVAIGYGTLRALDTGDPTLGRWVTISGLCDLVDATATAMAFRSLPWRGRILGIVVAGAAATASLVARDRLE